MVIVVALTLVIAALALIGTRWKALPWVPDAETIGAASPSEATTAPPTIGAPADLATGLEVPWGLTFLPDGRALVGERPSGDVSVITVQGDVERVGTVPGVADDGEGGLLGVVTSPTFDDDQFVYAYVTTNTDNRVVRMRLKDDRLVGARPC